MTKKPSTRAPRASNPSEGSGSTFDVDSFDQIKALAHPLRQRILERFGQGPATTKQVAERLGEKPTRLYHHVSVLERAGLVRLVETRQKRGTTEKYFETVAGRLRIDPSVLSGGQAIDSPSEVSKGVVEGLIENMRSELAQLAAQDPPPDGRAEEALFAQLEVRGDDARLDEVRAQLEELLRELQAESRGPAAEFARGKRLVLGWYPLPE